MLHDLITTPKAAVTTHGAPALKDAIRACVDAALLAQVRDACHKAGLSLLSINAQRRISKLTVGACNTCGRVDVEVSGGLLRSHLRKVGDPDGGACVGSGDAPVAAVVAVPVVEVDPFGDLPVMEAPPEDVHAVAARLGWTLEVIQDLGGRSEQQYRWAVVEVDGALLAVVADGMGGHHGGAEAAERAVAAFVETVRKRGASLSALRTALYTADAALAPHGRRAPGTTLTALLLTDDAAHLCHAGDSAALRWDDNGWVDVTIRHGAGNIVDLCLGGGGLESSELTPQLEPLPPADVWLLCSDGLVPDIGRAGLWSGGSLRRLAPADLGADTLGRSLAAAREAGSTDNATAILLRRTVTAPPEKTREEDRAEAARELSEWTNSEPADLAGCLSYDDAEGEPVKMSCPLCRELVDARRWRIGQPLYALRRHGVCSQAGRTLPTVAPEAASETPAEVSVSGGVLVDRLSLEPLSEIEPTPLTPRQADLLPRLLDVQSVSFEARQLLDEPRWSDTGEPVEDDAPLLREALRLEVAGKNRSSYTADFERKLAILNDGRRLPKRGREAVVVVRLPVDDEPLAGEEMPEVEPRSFEDVWREDYPDGTVGYITAEDFSAAPPGPVSDAVLSYTAGSVDAAYWGAVDRRRGLPRHLCPFTGAEAEDWRREWDACDEDMRSGLPGAVGWVPVIGESRDFGATLPSMPGMDPFFEPMTNVTGPGAVLTRETLEAGDAALRADADRVGDIVDADFDPDAAPISDPAYQPIPLLTGNAPSAAPISTPEPAPVAGTGDVWAEIIAVEPEPSLREVFAARRQFGIDKYGTPLQRNNGRDHGNDLDQELCDGVVYARAAERPATETILRDLLFRGEAYAEDVTNVGAAPRSLYYALGVSDLTAAHQRIDALRQAEKGLEQILTAAGEGSTAVGVARELGRKPGPATDEPKITLSVEGAEASQIAALKAQVETLETQVALQRGRIRRLLEYVNEAEKQVTVPEGWTALDEDGCDLADYRAQILDIDDCLNEVDPDNRARSEDDTTAGQVISILRRMVDGSEDLAAALQPTDAGVKATLVELGGNPPRAVFVADVSRKTAQRLGKSPGLYGRVVVLLKGEGQ